MQIESEKRADFLVVTPGEKRLEASNAPVFKNRMLELVAQGNSRIILDLGRVDFVDSSGLSAILSLLKALGEEGEMAICGPNPKVTTLFRLTRLDRILKIFPTPEEALADYR